MGGNNEFKEELLGRIFNCSLPRFKDYKEIEQPSHVIENCARRDFCFAHGTKEFCQPPFCERDQTENRKACSRGSSAMCPGPSVFYEEAVELCESKKHLSLKTIRMTLLSEFDAFLQRNS